MSAKAWLAKQALSAAALPGGAMLQTVVSVIGGIRACIYLAFALWFMWSAHSWKGAAQDADNARAVAVAEKAAAIAEHQALQASLADAQAAAERAIALKAAAEKDAARKLAQARKDWEKVYGAKPENRAWADAPLPADVERRLRDH